MIKLVNVVVDYNNELEILNYALELTKQTVMVHLVIVVNKEGEYGIHKLDKELSKINISYQIILPGNNIGYLNALLYGYKLSNIKTKWVIFSNTDIEIPDNKMLEKFLDNDFDSEYCIIGPSVVTKITNQYSNPYMLHRPKKSFYNKRLFLMRFPKIYNSLSLIKNKRNKLNFKKESCEAYCVHGCFFFMNSCFIELIKNNKWELLYNEEQYLGECAIKYNEKIYYDSTIEVIHTQGATTSKVNLKTTYARLRKANNRILNEFYKMR